MSTTSVKLSTTNTTETFKPFLISLNEINERFKKEVNEPLHQIVDDLNTKESGAEYKRKFLELKEKFTKLKKIKYTDTEQLFKDFTIAAEIRDSDSKKLINKLKNGMESSNKTLKNVLSVNHDFDYEGIKKEIIQKREEEERATLSQLKTSYEEKIKELEEKNLLLTQERDLSQSHSRSLQEELDKRKVLYQQNIEELHRKYNEDRVNSMKKVEEKLQESVDMINQLQREKDELVQKTKSELEVVGSKLTEKANQYNDLVKQFESAQQSFLQNTEELKQNKDKEIEKTIQEYTIKSEIFKKDKDSELKRYLEEYTNLELKRKQTYEELLENNKSEYESRLKSELESLEKKLTQEIDESESKRIKENQESINLQESLLSQIQQYKIQCDKSNEDHLTSTSISIISDNKYEILISNPKEKEKKIQGEIIIGEDNNWSYNPISIDNCPKVRECIETQIDFPKEEGIGFMRNLLDSIH
eukprot:gene7511-9232_t